MVPKWSENGRLFLFLGVAGSGAYAASHTFNFASTILFTVTEKE
ncbi:MAG: hypothetical protein AAF614_11590 [Chloroflexota bacterium]